MALAPGTIVIVGSGSNTGRQATVLGPAVGDRVPVYVSGYSDSAGFRGYLEASLRAVAPPAPPPTVPPVLPPTPPPASSPFQTLVMDERFDTLDLARWGLYDGPGHEDHGLRLSQQWRVMDGIPGAVGRCLVGTARWAGLEEALRLIPTWLSSSKKTELMESFKRDGGAVLAPGMGLRGGELEHRFEFRMRTEKDMSGVTASNFLTWPDDGSWPDHGEVNVWETTGAGNPERTPMHSYVHWSKDNLQKSYSHAVDGSQWHDIAYEKTADYIRMWCDGVLLVDFTEKAKIPTWNHHPTLQLDALRNAPPAGEIHVFFDYVRKYRR